MNKNFLTLIAMVAICLFSFTSVVAKDKSEDENKKEEHKDHKDHKKDKKESKKIKVARKSAELPSINVTMKLARQMTLRKTKEKQVMKNAKKHLQIVKQLVNKYVRFYRRKR